MLFSSIPFLYYFLPVVLILYFLAPKGWRNALLLTASLVFYGWGEPKYLLLMAGAILAFYLFGIAVGSAQGKWRRLWLTAAVVTGVLLLGIFKYADFFMDSFSRITGLSLPRLRLALPIGISFYLFQCVSYVADVYRGQAAPQKSIVKFGAYVAMFPQLIAGPIVRYVEVAPQLDSREVSREDLCLGARRFLIGLGKKVLLANQFGQLTANFRGCGEPSTLFYWMYAIGFTLQIYFDFSGYSDMAIGLGRVLGFRFPENFHHPYLSKSVTEFWRRWHISLGSWFRDYVYIPLGGSRVSRGRWVRNILAVWMLTGLWHGAAWNFVLWGLIFAVLLLAEKWLPGIQKAPSWLRHGYVLLAVTLSFVVFNGESMGQIGADFAGLFGLAGAPAVNAVTLYNLRGFALLFLAGAVGASELPQRLWARLPEGFRALAEPILLAALLLVCTAYLVDGSFNPFLYFRF